MTRICIFIPPFLSLLSLLLISASPLCLVSSDWVMSHGLGEGGAGAGVAGAGVAGYCSLNLFKDSFWI
jgi:hypothetical protein